MSHAKEITSFGPFRLIVSERLLTEGGTRVVVGSRALDILIELVSQPNEIFSKKDLLARVWPDVTVGETSLRFHIRSLRKALGDGKSGARYITTLAGRGYCFVAPVSRSSDRDAGFARVIHPNPHPSLPSRLPLMVGRDEDILRVSAQIASTRFVSIVGAGGMGKTTVAVAVGHHLMEEFPDGVLFVDLGMLGDPALVAPAVASTFGLSVQSDDATSSLVAHLRDKRLLLIFDTCEHLIETVAALAARLFLAGPEVHILATSRETLQVEGEYVYKLDSLAYPSDDETFTAADVQAFPAPRLFIECAIASGARLDLTDAEAMTIASMCRRLDGVPLAIELTAKRVETYGLQHTAALVDRRLTSLWLGPRTAPPRQKTLQATLDWSYALLSELERVALRRLATFVGHFTLEEAVTAVTCASVDQSNAFDAIESLVAKSMVAIHQNEVTARYRLLDATRAYAVGIDADAMETAELPAPAPAAVAASRASVRVCE